MNTDLAHIELLQSTPFFGAINDESIRFLLARSEILDRKAGEFYFHQDELGDSLFLLEQGVAIAFKIWEGREFILRQINSGDCFGELALIDFSPRYASLRAVTDCSAIKISSAVLHQLYQHNSEQFLIIQMNITRELSRRLRKADERWFQQQIDHSDNLDDTIFARSQIQ